MTRKAITLADLQAMSKEERVEPTPEQIARGLEHRFVTHVESSTKAMAHVSAHSPVERWEAKGRLSDRQMASDAAAHGRAVIIASQTSSQPRPASAPTRADAKGVKDTKPGRPRGFRPMTRNRQRVLAEYAAAIQRGERISLAELARRCGIYSYRNARRTLRDLQRMGMVK